jgi:colicin import membrane protein
MQAQKKARQQHALEQELAKQVAAEQAALAAKQSAKQSVAAEKTINRYKAKIIQAIAQHWVMPKDVDQQLSCQLLLHLAPGGQVLAVRVLRVSGNAVLDRSVRAAVNKASPLPVPTDRHLFDKFRVLRLTVHPEDMN